MTGRTSSVGSKQQTGTLTWNANGTLQRLQINDQANPANTQTCTYGYDDLTRLTSDSCDAGWSQTFGYDTFGNIWKAGSINFNQGYVGGNHVIGFSYDGDGNVTNDGSNTYTYDAEGRPANISGRTAIYDAFNRLVEMQTPSGSTQIVYAPDGFKFAYMNGQTVQKYIAPLVGGVQAVYTAATPAPPAYWRHSDWLGSSRLASTPQQTVYYDGMYAPFGENYGESGALDRSFTGQTQDITLGLYDFTFRQQSASQGRWLVPDPAGMAAVDITNPQTWNRYAYVANNPLSNVDPLGLHFCASDDALCDSDDGWDGDGGGGGGGGGWNPCGAYCAPPSGIISNVPTLTNAYQQSLGVYLSCLGYNFNCDANGNYKPLGAYVFTGANGNVVSNQSTLAATKFGELACSGMSTGDITSCIQQAYDTMGPAVDLEGGHYDFSLANIQITINGMPVDTNPEDFPGCLFGRCGLFNSADFSHGDGTFHVDMGNVYFFPVGTAVHVIGDVWGGHSWWSGGVPPFPW